MAVPSSGPLNMSKLAKEKLYDDYDSTNSFIGPIFMSDLVTGGSASGSGENYDITNTGSPSYPDNVTPHAFSEWRGYDHDYVTCAPFGFYEMFVRQGSQIYTGVEPEYATIASPDPKVLRANPFGAPSKWRWFSINLQDPLAAAQFIDGCAIRPQVYFENNGGADLRGDVCISGDWLFLDENGQVTDYQPLTGGTNEIEYYPRVTGWTIRPNKIPSELGQRGFYSGDPTNPENVVAWSSLAYGSTLQTSDNWNYNSGPTPTSGTGPDLNVYLDPYRGSGFAVWLADNILDPFMYINDPTVVQTSNGYFYYEASGSYATPSYNWWRWKEPRYVPPTAKYLTFAYCAWSEDGPSTFTNDKLKVFIESVDASIEPPPTFS